jgi:hypothetical protein
MIMKSKILRLLTTVLMVGGMLFAQEQGALPGSKKGTNERGWISAADSGSKLPGVAALQNTEDLRTGPATGTQNGQSGGTLTGRDLLPGIRVNATLSRRAAEENPIGILPGAAAADAEAPNAENVRHLLDSL